MGFGAKDKVCKYAPAQGVLQDAAKETERLLTRNRAPLYLALSILGGTLTYMTGLGDWWWPPVTCMFFGMTAFVPFWMLRCGKPLPYTLKYWSVGADLLCTLAIQLMIAHHAPQYESFAMTNLVGFLVVIVATAGIRMDKVLSVGAAICAALILATYIRLYPGVGRIYFFMLLWMAGWFAFMTTDIVRRAAERDALARFMPDKVAQRIIMHPDSLKLGGESVLVTVMFTDLRGFTAMAATMAPHAVVQLLNMVHQVQVAAVFEEGGTVNKFTGDGMLAFFGAPEPHPDPTRAALRAARRIQDGLAELSAELGLEVRAGVGIHKGNVVAGNVGSALQLEYTIIGDTVNVASRLESLCKEFDETILLSREAADDVEEGLFLKNLGSVALKGHPHPMEVFAAAPFSLPALDVSSN